MVVTVAICVTAVGGEVEVVDVIVQIVLLTKALELFLGGKLDTARAVDVHVPPTRLLAVFALFQFPLPSRRQRLVVSLKFLWQM